MNNSEVIKFFEELTNSIEFHKELENLVRDEMIYGNILLTQNQIGYGDPDLQTIFEVIES